MTASVVWSDRISSSLGVEVNGRRVLTAPLKFALPVEKQRHLRRVQGFGDDREAEGDPDTRGDAQDHDP